MAQQAKIRKEVNLTSAALKILRKLAKKEKRPLKPFLERILVKYAEENCEPKKV